MTLDWQGAWAAVIHHPLFGIGITLGAYQLVLAGFEKTRWIFLQPVLVSMLLVIGVLLGCGLTYVEYRKSTEPTPWSTDARRRLPPGSRAAGDRDNLRW